MSGRLGRKGSDGSRSWQSGWFDERGRLSGTLQTGRVVGGLRHAHTASFSAAKSVVLSGDVVMEGGS